MSLPAASTTEATPARRGSWLGGDAVLGVLTRGAAVLLIVLLAGLLVVLIRAAWPSITANGIGFLTGTEWRPNEIPRPKLGPDGGVLIEDGEVVMEMLAPSFAALPVVYGTAVTSIIGLLVATPLALGAAIFVVRVAPRVRLAGPVSFLIEFLAAIPSIAYGIWGMFVLVPFLRDRVEPLIRGALGDVPALGWMFYRSVEINGEIRRVPIPTTGRDMLCGGLILGVMILPIITSVSRDVLKSVPRGQIEGVLALGATWWQSCWGMLRYSRSGLFGAVMLGLARAAGETMAVTMVIGNNNQVRASLFEPAQTMSSLLALEFGEAGLGSMKKAALFEVALILLAMSLVFNIVARRLVVGRGATGAAAH